jgi:phage terminase large subunit
VPHDARVREFGSGRTRIEAMLSLGRKPRVVPAHTLMDGINAARQTIPLAYFDAARCGKGIEALREYKAEWDDELRTFKKTPLHNWASHAADAFRYLAMAWREPMVATEEKPNPIAELLKQRTWDDVWQMHVEERIDLGVDPNQFLTLT